MIAKKPLRGAGLALLILGAGFASSEASDDHPKDHFPRLTTKGDKVYENVEIVKVDPNGLLFRHRTGSAKVPFADLSAELQARYHYNEIAAEEFENLYRGKGLVHSRVATGGKGAGAGKESGLPTATGGVVWTRVTVTLPPPALSGAGFGGDPGWSPSPSPYGFWRMPHPLVYAAYPWRQLAERDFLITTGLLPAPAGVVPLPLHRALRYW